MTTTATIRLDKDQVKQTGISIAQAFAERILDHFEDKQIRKEKEAQQKEMKESLDRLEAHIGFPYSEALRPALSTEIPNACQKCTCVHQEVLEHRIVLHCMKHDIYLQKNMPCLG